MIWFLCRRLWQWRLSMYWPAYTLTCHWCDKLSDNSRSLIYADTAAVTAMKRNVHTIDQLDFVICEVRNQHVRFIIIIVVEPYLTSASFIVSNLFTHTSTSKQPPVHLSFTLNLTIVTHSTTIFPTVNRPCLQHIQSCLAGAVVKVAKFSQICSLV